MLKNTVTLALAAIALAAAPTAHAQEVQNSISVKHADLDLSTEAGRQELDNRINSAARDVCGMDEVKTSTRIASRSSRDCYREARRQIEQQVATLVRDGTRLGG